MDAYLFAHFSHQVLAALKRPVFLGEVGFGKCFKPKLDNFTLHLIVMFFLSLTLNRQKLELNYFLQMLGKQKPNLVAALSL